MILGQVSFSLYPVEDCRTQEDFEKQRVPSGTERREVGLLPEILLVGQELDR